jgi:hypothetical protein
MFIGKLNECQQLKLNSVMNKLYASAAAAAALDARQVRFCPDRRCWKPNPRRMFSETL